MSKMLSYLKDFWKGRLYTKEEFIAQQDELFRLKNELNKTTEHLESLAYTDPITNLPNRHVLENRITTYFSHEKEGELALLLVNIDRFHQYNDIFGHAFGDALLNAFGERLRNTTEEAFVARYIGDEFVVLIENSDTAGAVEIVQSVLKQFEEPIYIKGEEIVVSLAIGVSFSSSFTDSEKVMMRFAKESLIEAKKKPSERYSLFNGSRFEEIDRKSGLEHDLKKALERNQFHLVYQPIVEMKTQEIVGVEALLRWNHPVFGEITPSEFIPIAERTGFIVPIGQWAIKEACEQAKVWHNKGHKLHVSVNVSVRQILQKDFRLQVKSILKDTGLSPHYLKLEITESMMQNPVESKRILTELKTLGVSLSLDDFGTGYASLSLLGDLPFDYLKIDRSFIRDIPENSRSRAIVGAIIEMGNSLNFKLIGEGIEEVKHMDYLLNEGCSLGQGYLFSRPILPLEIEKLLQSQTLVAV